MSLHRSHLLQQFQRIEIRGDLAQLTLGGNRDTLRLQETLARRLWRMIALGHLCAVALFGSQFERGLEEVHEQPGRSVEARDCPRCRQAFKAPIAQELAHNGAVLLLDPRLIVLAVGPRTGEFDAVTQAIFDQPVVDELAAVVHIQRSQGEGQAHADALECFDHEATFSNHDRRGLRPSARDIGQNQAVNVAAAV